MAAKTWADPGPLWCVLGLNEYSEESYAAHSTCDGLHMHRLTEKKDRVELVLGILKLLGHPLEECFVCRKLSLEGSNVRIARFHHVLLMVG